MQLTTSMVDSPPFISPGSTQHSMISSQEEALPDKLAFLVLVCSHIYKLSLYTHPWTALYRNSTIRQLHSGL